MTQSETDLQPEPSSPIWSSSVVERFFERVDKTEGGCWLWQGSRDSNDAPRMYTSKARNYVPAARVSWEIEHRRRLTKRERVYLECANGKACVYPGHMLIVGAGRRPTSPRTAAPIVVQTAPDVGIKGQLLLQHLGHAIRNGEQIRAAVALMRRELAAILPVRRELTDGFDDLRRMVQGLAGSVAVMGLRIDGLVAALQVSRDADAVPDAPPPATNEIAYEPTPEARYYLSVVGSPDEVITGEGERALHEVMERALHACETDPVAAIDLYGQWLLRYLDEVPADLRSPLHFLAYAARL